MADPMSVARRGWSDRRRSRWGWALGLAAYMVMMLAVWPSLDSSASFADVAEEYPDALKALFGGNEAFETITEPAGFVNSYVFSFMVPMLLVVLATGIGASMIGGEEEDGLIDLLLAYPITRRRVVAEKALVVSGQVTVAVVAVVAVIVAGAPLVDLDVSTTGVLAAGLGSLLYGVLHGMIALGAGAATGSRSTAIAIGAVVAVVGYVISTISELASWAEPLRVLSPLEHATVGNPVVNGVPANYLVLVAAIAVVAVATTLVFERRELS